MSPKSCAACCTYRLFALLYIRHDKQHRTPPLPQIVLVRKQRCNRVRQEETKSTWVPSAGRKCGSCTSGRSLAETLGPWHTNTGKRDRKSGAWTRGVSLNANKQVREFPQTLISVCAVERMLNTHSVFMCRVRDWAKPLKQHDWCRYCKDNIAFNYW